MRELLVYMGGFAPVGGIESFLTDLLREFRARDDAVSLVCWGAESELTASLGSAGVRMMRVPWRWGCRFGWPDRLLLRASRSRVRAARVVLFGKTFSPAIHARLRRLNPRARFVLVTAYRPLEFWEPHEFPQVAEILATFDLVVVQADSFVRDLREIGYRGETAVLPYLPPASGEIADFPASPPYRVGYVGRLARQKNLGYLLESFRELEAGSGPRYELSLFGDGPERPALERKIRELALSGSVHLAGRIDRSDVGAAIDGCHVVAISSTSEGQCLVVLEALARGRPVVSTPVGAIPGVVDSPVMGRLVPLAEPGAFADGIRQVCREIEQGKVVPGRIAAEYQRRYRREQTFRAYRRAILGD